MPIFPEYEQYDALGLAELVKTKQISPRELIEAAIERIETRNPALNAVVHTTYDEAFKVARGELPDGPFKGVPILIKDLALCITGQPTSSGNRALKGWIAPIDSEIITRMRAAGLIFIGKTNTPEFGLTPYTESDALGPCRNPWDTTRTSGGSSGGSAAAVAARMTPIASASDGGGSIRIPAACCGLFGLKPTRARTPIGPIIGEAWEGCTADHVVSRSVRDSAAMLDALAGSDVGAPYAAPHQTQAYANEILQAPGKLRIAFSTKALIGPNLKIHKDCQKGLEQTIKLLQELGHEAIEDSPQIDAEQLSLDFVTMLFAQVRNDIDETAAVLGRKPSRDMVELTTWVLGMMGQRMSAADYVAATRRLRAMGRPLGRFFQHYDVLLTPTLSQPPVKIGELKPSATEQQLLGAIARANAGWALKALNLVKQLANKTFSFIPFTPLFNVTGQPAMSVPLHWNEAGLPIGMQFVGRFGDEATLLRLAAQLEQAKPWAGRMPSFSTALVTRAQ